MKVALCCIGRLENRYIREYVGFYLGIGVDKIFLYDNNYDGEEYFEDVIGDYVSQGSVEVINYRNKERCQVTAYQDCYDKHGSEYDWICFFDIDEFILLENEKNLKDLLNYDIYQNYDMIHINWLCYGDCGLVRYEDKPVLERFKYPIIPLHFRKNLSIPENLHVKSIIRGGISYVEWSNTPHTPTNDLKCCDSNGVPCVSSSPFLDSITYKNICLRHYTTKTIEEFYTIKVKREFPDGNKNWFKTHSWVREFFSVNKKTDEKIDFLKEIGYMNLDMFIGTYKTFTPIVKNPVYKIIYGNHNIIENDTLKHIKCVSDEPLDDKFYSEIYMLKNLPKDYDLAKYVGFCHYRKYFDFFDNIPDLDSLFNEYDAVMADPTVFKTNIKNQYAKYHNIEDLEIVEDIIKNDFSEYYESLENVLNRDYLYCLNMFIMKKEDFNNYIKFIDSVLQKYIERVGVDIKKRIEDNKEKYLKDFSPNDTVDYQYRIGGYLAERLTNVFAEKHFKNIKTYKVKITEYKY